MKRKEKRKKKEKKNLPRFLMMDNKFESGQVLQPLCLPKYCIMFLG